MMAALFKESAKDSLVSIQLRKLSPLVSFYEAIQLCTRKKNFLCRAHLTLELAS